MTDKCQMALSVTGEEFVFASEEGVGGNCKIAKITEQCLCGTVPTPEIPCNRWLKDILRTRECAFY